MNNLHYYMYKIKDLFFIEIKYYLYYKTLNWNKSSLFQFAFPQQWIYALYIVYYSSFEISNREKCGGQTIWENSLLASSTLVNLFDGHWNRRLKWYLAQIYWEIYMYGRHMPWTRTVLLGSRWKAPRTITPRTLAPRWEAPGLRPKLT